MGSRTRLRATVRSLRPADAGLLDALIAESPDLQPVIARLLRRIADGVTAGLAGELQGLAILQRPLALLH